jgi:hypothetical protein
MIEPKQIAHYSANSKIAVGPFPTSRVGMTTKKVLGLRTWRRPNRHVQPWAERKVQRSKLFIARMVSHIDRLGGRSRAVLLNSVC